MHVHRKPDKEDVNESHNESLNQKARGRRDKTDSWQRGAGQEKLVSCVTRKCACACVICKRQRLGVWGWGELAWVQREVRNIGREKWILEGRGDVHRKTVVIIRLNESRIAWMCIMLYNVMLRCGPLSHAPCLRVPSANGSVMLLHRMLKEKSLGF